MKRLSLLLLLFFAMVGCSAPHPASTMNPHDKTYGLHSALREYTDATINHEVDKLMTFVYPKVFNFVSRDTMLGLLRKLYHSGKAPKITGITHKNISDIQVYEEGVYSLIVSDMYMELRSPVMRSPEHEMFYYMMLKEQMGANSTINFDRKRHLYHVKKDSRIIGINENNEGWKFIGYEQAKKYASRNIIPKQIAMNLE